MEASPTSLSIAQPLLDLMLAHATAVYPEEACGLLAGSAPRIDHLYAVENRLHSPTAFEMDPRQQVQAMLDAEAQGLTLLATYHSHPAGPAYPSASDVARATYPELAHIIIALEEQQRPSVRAFTIVAERIHEIPWWTE